MSMDRRDFLRAAVMTAVAAGMPLNKAIASVCDTAPSVGGGSGPITMDIVPEDRRDVWNPGIYGGIPQDSWNPATSPNGVGPALKHGATLSPGADIQAALNAAAAVATKDERRYVQLGAGTFTVTSNINIPSYVILRGTLSGSTRQTIIRQSGFFVPVAISGTFSGGWQTKSLGGGGFTVKGDGQIVLNDASGLSVGDIIMLDHLSDGDRSGKDGPISWSGSNATASGVTKDWDDTPSRTGACVFGNSSLYEVRYDYNTPDPNGGQDFPDSPSSGRNDGGWRHMCEMHEILAINGNTITIYQEPTTLAQDGQGADVCGSPSHMWYYNDAEVYNACGASGTFTEYAGCEDIKFELYGEAGNGGKPAVILNRCKLSWVKNCETDGTYDADFKSRHIQLENFTYRCELEGNYIHGQSDYFPGGGYGINVQGSEHYIHNNVAKEHNKPINLEAASGCVIAFNYVDNAILSGQNAWNESGIGTHASFCHSNLFEGNDTNNVTIDSTHGNNGFNMIYRNSLRGRNTLAGAPEPFASTASTALNRAVMADFLCWETTSIGNVLYSDAFQAGREFTSGHSTTWFTAITNDALYLMGHNGWNSSGVSNENVDNDFARGNLHQHYEYQYLSGFNRLYLNGANPETTLDDSLHRETTPAYFSGYTYPPIDPDGANYAAKVADLPARDRYDGGNA